MFLLFKGYIKLEYTTNKTAYSKDQELFVLTTLDKYLQRKKTWPATGDKSQLHSSTMSRWPMVERDYDWN